MTPAQFIRQAGVLPFDLRPYQDKALDALAPLPRAGHYLDVGCGKTLTAIACAVWKLRHEQAAQVVCIVPPILLAYWGRMLASVKGVSHVVYQGTPTQRRKIDLSADFIVMGWEIMRIDHEYLYKYFYGKPIFLVCDEAQAAKNVATRTHRTLRHWAKDNHLALLSY
jgi:N12 class adenine-specific DNA methylase